MIMAIVVMLMNYSARWYHFLKSIFANPVFPLADGF